jgi:hypothetical protein
MRTTITIDQKGCARCHGEGHPQLTFSKLTHPLVEESGLELTHWAPCPTNGEPILLAVVRPSAEDRAVAALQQFGTAFDDAVRAKHIERRAS